VIPQNIIDKAPSAELRPDQTDQDSLPPYPVLDDILECLVEGEMGVDEIVARGHDRELVHRIEHLLYIAEYKRRQAAPGVKITRKNFGRDRAIRSPTGSASASFSWRRLAWAGATLDLGAVTLLLVALPLIAGLVRVQRAPARIRSAGQDGPGAGLDARRGLARPAVLSNCCSACWRRASSARPSFSTRSISSNCAAGRWRPLPHPFTFMAVMTVTFACWRAS
jgi:hypothetical protein